MAKKPDYRNAARRAKTQAEAAVEENAPTYKRVTLNLREDQAQLLDEVALRRKYQEGQFVSVSTVVRELIERHRDELEKIAQSRSH
jgi:hypothetical protein